MKSTFLEFLTENRSVDVMMTRMAREVEVIDKDMGNVFVVRDNKMGKLTGKEHTFDVRFHGHGDIEVHAHSDNDHDRARELERMLLESTRDHRADTLALVQKSVGSFWDKPAKKTAGRSKAQIQTRERDVAKLKAKYGDDWEAMDKAARKKLADDHKKNSKGDSWSGYGTHRQNNKKQYTGD